MNSRLEGNQQSDATDKDSFGSRYCRLSSRAPLTQSDGLQVFRHKAHPKFFASANDKDGDEQDDQIAFQPEEVCEPLEAVHAQSCRNAAGNSRVLNAKATVRTFF